MDVYVKNCYVDFLRYHLYSKYLLGQEYY